MKGLICAHFLELGFKFLTQEWHVIKINQKVYLKCKCIYALNLKC